MKTLNTIVMPAPEEPCVQAVLASLNAQTEHYSVATQMRLNEARARAIAATRAEARFWHRPSILGAAFACAAALAFVVLTQPASVSKSAEFEATALYEATFGAEPAEAVAANPEAFFVAEFEQAALDETGLDDSGLDDSGLDETGLDEAVVANDLEFYAWLSESTNAERAPAGSGS